MKYEIRKYDEKNQKPKSYLSVLRFMNNSKNKEIEITFKDDKNEIKKEVVLIRNFKKSDYRKNNKKILSIVYKPLITDDKIKELLKNIDLKSMEKPTTKIKVYSPRKINIKIPYIDDKKQINEINESVTYTTIKEEIIKENWINKLLRSEIKSLKFIDDKNQREKFLFFSLSSYFGLRNVVFNRTEQHINRIYDDKKFNNDDKIKLNSWIYEFLEEKSKNHDDKNTYFLNMVSEIGKQHKKSKVVFYFENIINSKTIKVYLESGKNKENFFKLSSLKFGFIDNKKLSEIRKYNKQINDEKKRKNNRFKPMVLNFPRQIKKSSSLIDWNKRQEDFLNYCNKLIDEKNKNSLNLSS